MQPHISTLFPINYCTPAINMLSQFCLRAFALPIITIWNVLPPEILQAHSPFHQLFTWMPSPSPSKLAAPLSPPAIPLQLLGLLHLCSWHRHANTQYFVTQLFAVYLPPPTYNLPEGKDFVLLAVENQAMWVGMPHHFKASVLPLRSMDTLLISARFPSL